jgi:hypothetical protein
MPNLSNTVFLKTSPIRDGWFLSMVCKKCCLPRRRWYAFSVFKPAKRSLYCYTSWREGRGSANGLNFGRTSSTTNSGLFRRSLWKIWKKLHHRSSMNTKQKCRRKGNWDCNWTLSFPMRLRFGIFNIEFGVHYWLSILEDFCWKSINLTYWRSDIRNIWYHFHHCHLVFLISVLIRFFEKS